MVNKKNNMKRLLTFILALTFSPCSGESESSSNHSQKQDDLKLQKFIAAYSPPDKPVKPRPETIAKYKNKLPECIIELWTEHGFGHYGDGLIQIIDPDIYDNNLWGWLMVEKDTNRIPIALSAFGHIYYYRKLSDRGDEDIAFINPHTSQTGVLTWDIKEFFNEWCCDADNQSDYLEKELAAKASKKCGKLNDGEIYYYAPAIRLGGESKLENIKKGNALVHLAILLELALDR